MLNFYGIFKLCHKDLLLEYIKRSSNHKFKYLLTDTTFIPNKKGKDCMGYSKFYNRKNGTKISIITDAKSISLNMKCHSGNKHDSKILIDQLKHFDTVWDNHDLHDKTIFMADPVYDCMNIRNKLKELNFDPLIHQNKRNIKDPTKIIKMNYNQKKLYRKRLRVEHAFNKLKMNRRLMIRYDGKIDSVYTKKSEVCHFFLP